MANRPEFVEFDVGSATLGALRWPGLLGTPTIVAIHGLTSNAWAWDPVVHHLSGGAEVIAVDLRGRGRSLDAPIPFGIRQHADDVAAIVDQLGRPAFVVGHSMGAFVAMMTDERHPDAVRAIVLVDAGPPVPRPSGHGVDVDAALDSTLGPALERIGRLWPDRVSYHAMWSAHPAFVEGIGPDLERNLLAELVEVEGGFRVAVSEAAVRWDGRELLGDDEVRTLLDRRATATTIVRAEFGMLGEPPGFVPPADRDRYPQHGWVEAPGLNHYTVMNSAAGAALVADTLRQMLVR
jgi:pimeloyl-ACP methyl ester carboxylesterase